MNMSGVMFFNSKLMFCEIRYCLNGMFIREYKKCKNISFLY